MSKQRQQPGSGKGPEGQLATTPTQQTPSPAKPPVLAEPVPEQDMEPAPVPADTEAAAAKARAAVVEAEKVQFYSAAERASLAAFAG